jgi:hypothetical protein
MMDVDERRRLVEVFLRRCVTYGARRRPSYDL